MDELAGRGGRGPEDDPLRLDARGILQFLRASMREKSLAAFPMDLLPTSTACQVKFTMRGKSVWLAPDACCLTLTKVFGTRGKTGAEDVRSLQERSDGGWKISNRFIRYT